MERSLTDPEPDRFVQPGCPGQATGINVQPDALTAFPLSIRPYGGSRGTRSRVALGKKYGYSPTRPPSGEKDPSLHSGLLLSAFYPYLVLECPLLPGITWPCEYLQ